MSNLTKGSKTSGVCRHCGAGVNGSERIHWWCRKLELKKLRLRP